MTEGGRRKTPYVMSAALLKLNMHTQTSSFVAYQTIHRIHHNLEVECCPGATFGSITELHTSFFNLGVI